MVECQLPKLDVAGSNPVARSSLHSQFIPIFLFIKDYFTLIHPLLNKIQCQFPKLDVAGFPKGLLRSDPRRSLKSSFTTHFLFPYFINFIKLIDLIPNRVQSRLSQDGCRGFPKGTPSERTPSLAKSFHI